MNSTVKALKSLSSASQAGSRRLTSLGVASAAATLAMGPLSLLDPRQIAGASVWLKPAKFGVSIAVLAFTLALLLGAIDLTARRKRRAELVISSGLWLELGLITMQAARGVASHFNSATPFDRAVYITMGAGITIVTLEMAAVGIAAFRTRFQDAALGAGIRSGFALAVLGSLLAFLMTRPTPAQVEQIARSGELPAVVGAHTVGAADGGEGMPITRWSRDGGDLRIPHFAGVHALQIMPLIGFALGRRRPWGARAAHRLTRVAAGSYLGLVSVALVQALRGQPFLAPDALTWALLASVAAGTGIAVAAVRWQAQRDRGCSPRISLTAAARIP